MGLTLSQVRILSSPPLNFLIVRPEWPQIDRSIEQSKNRPGGDFLIGVSMGTLKSELACLG